jgi:glycosyltransferase involved in cell wall biosynthesis
MVGDKIAIRHIFQRRPMNQNAKPATSRPIISCVMPVYNCEKYLEESINSILGQTFRDFEFIIINDGSTDSSPKIIEAMRLIDDRIVLITQENKGITAAMNAGIAASRGELIARMDADDVAMRDRFQLQHDFLWKNPDVVLVGGVARSIDSLGKPAIGSDSTGSRYSNTNLLCFPPKVATALHPLIMVRADALKSIGGYSTKYLYAEDYEMFMRISVLGRIDQVDKRILDYRTHGKNTSVKKLAVQERHAAEAEIDNVRTERARHKRGALRVGADTFDAYVSIRILRREFDLGMLNGPAVYFNIISKIVRDAPKSAPYTTGRLLLMLAFHGLKTMKSLMIRERQSRGLLA